MKAEAETVAELRERERAAYQAWAAADRALLLKAQFAGTYEEAVALMHRWAAEYREERDD